MYATAPPPAFGGTGRGPGAFCRWSLSGRDSAQSIRTNDDRVVLSRAVALDYGTWIAADFFGLSVLARHWFYPHYSVTSDFS
jgi:hypothetical protein